MAKQSETHDECSALPATGQRARELGAALYFTGKRCTRGHLSPRYSSSGNCVECIGESRGRAIRTGLVRRVSEENQRRASAAASLGHRTYKATDPCPRGHYERFINNGNCSLCHYETWQRRRHQAKWRRVEKLYGLTEETFLLLVSAQGGACGLCAEPISGSGIHVDHCHATGKVRALLCGPCNQGIGLLRESPELLAKAIDYLRRHGK